MPFLKTNMFKLLIFAVIFVVAVLDAERGDGEETRTYLTKVKTIRFSQKMHNYTYQGQYAVC